MNVLIVEDDTMLRNWLSMLLSSLSDYQLQIHEARDGLEALEVCKAAPIELVITDIKMPRMDGLQLIQSLKGEFPSIRTAVLSAYNEFSFVKMALQYGALDYILKAEMTAQDLSQLLEKVQNDMQVERSLTKGIFPDYRTILDAQKAIADFTASDVPESQLWKSLSLPEDAQALTILFLHLQGQPDMDIPIFEAADICKKTLFSESLHGVAVPYQGENCLLLYACSDTVVEFQHLEAVKLSSLIENNFQKYLNLPLSFSLFRFYRRGENLRSCLGEAYQAAWHQQYYGANVKCVDTFPAFPDWKNRIQQSLETNHLQDASVLLKNYLEEAHRAHLSPDMLRTHLLVLLNMFATLYAKRHRNEGSLHTLLFDVTHAETRTQLELCTDIFLKTFLLTLNQKNLQFSPSVHSALNYVDSHYMEKISLSKVAEHVYMNRSYFCQLFKKEAGMTFGDYVEHIRIENAKRLLVTTDLPILSVAEQTGFHNQAYFTRVFKKATDISPLRYRKIHFQT